MEGVEADEDGAPPPFALRNEGGGEVGVDCRLERRGLDMAVDSF